MIYASNILLAIAFGVLLGRATYRLRRPALVYVPAAVLFNCVVYAVEKVLGLMN